MSNTNYAEVINEVLRQQSGFLAGAVLTVRTNSDKVQYVMYGRDSAGVCREHALNADCTDAARLLPHWIGFVQSLLATWESVESGSVQLVRGIDYDHEGRMIEPPQERIVSTHCALCGKLLQSGDVEKCQRCAEKEARRKAHCDANLHNALREAVMARHAWDRALSELGDSARVIDMPEHTRSAALQRITNYVCHVAHETEDARDVDADMSAYLRAELDKIANTPKPERDIFDEPEDWIRKQW